MSERTDQAVRGFARQQRVSVERDHKADRIEYAKIPDLHIVGCFLTASEEFIEFLQFAALSLPSHPTFFAGIPPPLTVKQVKRTIRWIAIFLIQTFDLGCGLRDQFIILWHLLFRCIGEIRQQGKENIRVVVGNKMKFHLADEKCDISLRTQKRWYHYHRSVFDRYTCFKLQLWQSSRWNDGNHQPVEKINGYSRSRRERKDRRPNDLGEGRAGIDRK